MSHVGGSRINKDAGIVVGVALTAALLVTFVIFRAQALVASTHDPYEFSEFGRRIAAGEGFRGEIIGRRAPLYPIFVGSIYWLFGHHEVLVQIAQCLGFAGTAWFAWDMARRVYTRRTAVFAGLLCALHPSLLRYVPDFHLESLFTLLLTFCVWASVKFYFRPSWQRAAIFGVAAGLASLTKAVVLLYPPLFVALFWLKHWFATRKASSGVPAAAPKLWVLALAVAAMALTISPWTIRNYHVSGKVVPVSTGLSDAFLRGFVFARPEFATLQKPPYTDAENEVNANFREICAKEGAVWEQDPLETDRILAKAAKAKLLSDPGGAVVKALTGIFTFWYEMTSLKTSLVAGGLALISWLLTFVGVPRALREGREQWLLLTPVLYLNAFLALLLALGRYSVPVLPCLMVTAAFGLDTLATRFGLHFLDSERAEPAVES